MHIDINREMLNKVLQGAFECVILESIFPENL